MQASERLLDIQVWVSLNPLMGMGAPNASIYQGGQFGQAQFVAGEPVMPSGFVFEGVRFFETTNMPSKSITVNINDGAMVLFHTTLLQLYSSVHKQLVLVWVVLMLRFLLTTMMTSADLSF